MGDDYFWFVHVDLFVFDHVCKIVFELMVEWLIVYHS